MCPPWFQGTHPCCGPCQAYGCSQAFLQPWTSILTALFDQEVGPFPEARPGAQTGSLAGSEPPDDGPYAQRPPERVVECPELCVCPVQDQGPPTPCSGPCEPSYNPPDAPFPHWACIHFLFSLTRCKGRKRVAAGWFCSWTLILHNSLQHAFAQARGGGGGWGGRAFLTCVSSHLPLEFSTCQL